MEVNYQLACQYVGEIVLEYKAKLNELTRLYTNLMESFKAQQAELQSARTRIQDLELQLENLKK